jgi:CBS domain-containing protein
MKIKELMTETVFTVDPEKPLKDVARILVENRISGVPVCNDRGDVIGVVSEGDILYKEHDPREEHSGGPLGWMIDGSPNYAGYVKAKALTAGKAMTSPAITISPDATVAQAARIMCERGVNRLPVVKGGSLVGIVTRADLVRAFVRTDAEIEQEVRGDVLRRTMWIDEAKVTVGVESGWVELGGQLHARSDVELLTRLARRVPGVVAVDSRVRWRVDDTTRKGRRGLEQPAR